MTFMETLKDPALRRAFEWQLADIDSGAMRAFGNGTSTPSCYTASIALVIQPKARSVDEAVAAWRAHSDTPGLDQVLVAIEPVNLLIGQAAKLTLELDPPEGVPSRTIVYVALLPDDRVAILAGTSPATDTDFRRSSMPLPDR